MPSIARYSLVNSSFSLVQTDSFHQIVLLDHVAGILELLVVVLLYPPMKGSRLA
jgi:hypothetical protein